MSDTTSTAVATTDGEFTEDFDHATGEIIEHTHTDAPEDAGTVVIRDAISRLQSNMVSVYSTVVGDDFDAKLTTMSAVTTARPIMEHLGEHIDLTNIVVQAVEISVRDDKGNQTGEKMMAPRVIFLDKSGVAYYGISPVLLRAVESFVGILGQPHTWPESGVPAKITRDKSNNGFYFFNLQIDQAAPTKITATKK